VALAAGWQANVWLDSMRAVQRGVEGYGTPLGYWRETAEHARQLAKQQEAAEILLVMPGDQPWDEKASILHTLLADSPHRTVDGQKTTVLPLHATLLVVASELPTALKLTGSARDLGDSLPASPFGGTYLFRMWSGGSVPAPLGEWSASPEPAAWASGARLLGYRFAGVPGPGQTVQVSLWWETSRSAPDLDVHWFNHLVDGEGTKWAQLDHGAWPSHKWQPGDQVLTYFPLAIDAQAPPGAFWLRVGQYSYPEVANIPLVDGDGNHRSDWVQLPVLTSGS
jgi:hypothetical protein